MSDFKSSYSWNHTVAVGFGVVRDKLAVTVVVCPLFRDRVENELDFGIEN